MKNFAVSCQIDDKLKKKNIFQIIVSEILKGSTLMNSHPMANVSEISLFTFCGRNSEEDIEEITEEVIIDFSKTAVS